LSLGEFITDSPVVLAQMGQGSLLDVLVGRNLGVVGPIDSLIVTTGNAGGARRHDLLKSQSVVGLAQDHRFQDRLSRIKAPDHIGGHQVTVGLGDAIGGQVEEPGHRNTLQLVLFLGVEEQLPLHQNSE